MLPIKKKDFLKSIRNLLVSSAVIACSVTHAMEEEARNIQLDGTANGGNAQEIVDSLAPIADPNNPDHELATQTQTLTVQNYDLRGRGLVFFIVPSIQMPNLKVLIVTNCQITNIEPIAFMNNLMLETLNLTNNNIVGHKPFAKCNFQNPMKLYLDDRGPEKAPCSLVRTKIPHFLGVPQMDWYVNPKFYYNQLNFIRIMTSTRFNSDTNEVELPEDYSARQFIGDHKEERLG